HAQADDVLAQFLELGNQGRKIAVPGDDHEGVDVFLGVGQVHGVHTEADVGRVLAALAAARDLDQFQGGLVQGGRVGGEPAPVRIGFLGDDLALFQQPFQHALDVKAVATVLESQGQVFEIKEDGQGTRPIGHAWVLCRDKSDELGDEV